MIVVVGGGAVGSFLGATLALAGQEVVLLRRGAPPGPQPLTITVDGPGNASRTAACASIVSAAIAGY